MKLVCTKYITYLFLVLSILTSCSDNKTVQEDEEKIDFVNSIKGINDRLHQGIGNKSIEPKDINHSYTFISENKGNLECYYELGYDSEGWPMAGNVYYFNEKELIGFGYVSCDGCIGQDVSNKLKSLPIKHAQSEDDLDEWDKIWIIEKPSQELKLKASEILNSYISNQDNSGGNPKSNSYGEIRGRIIGGNIRMLERELGSPSYIEVATNFIENSLGTNLPIGLFDLCLNYEVYVYENYLGDGQNLLVSISEGKVTNVLPQNDVQDVRDICCCD